MCRWTPRDTCYHFAPLGHLYRECEWADRMVIDRASRDNQWRHSQPILARNFQTNEIQLLIQEPSILLAGTSRQLFHRGPVFGCSNTLGRIDKKVWHAPEENGEKNQLMTIRKFAFRKLWKASKKFETREIETIGHRKRFNGAFCSFFFFAFCVFDALPKCNKPFPLVYCFADRMFRS